MRRLSAALSLLASVSLLACGGPIEERGPKIIPSPDEREPLAVIDLDGPDVRSVDGVAVDPATGDLHLLIAGQGIVVLGDDGSEKRVIAFDPRTQGEDGQPPAEAGFYDIGYRDIALLPDGAYVLAGPLDAHYFDPEEGSPASYFCLLPGFEEVVMFNSAVTLDPVTDLLVVAPTYYDTAVSMETPSEAYHATYFMDGTLQTSRDVLSSGMVAQGLARDAHGSEMFAVEHGELAVFSLDGELKRLYVLDGIESATGLTHDSVADVLYVTDADHEVRSFDAADFRD